MIITKEIYRESRKCLKKAYFMINSNYKEELSAEIIENFNEFKEIVIKYLSNKDIIIDKTFNYNNCRTKVDVLEKTDDGYNLYEIKSSRHININYLYDLSFQYYVASKNEKINKVFLVVPKTYYRKDHLEIDKLINIIDKTSELENVDIKNIGLIHNNRLTEICREKSIYCPFFKECTKDLNKENIFIYSKIQFMDKIKYYNMGIRDKKDVLKYPIKNIYKEELEDKVVKVNKIKRFIDTITYPLYFLDFETIAYLVPKYNNSKSNEKIVIEYSLHFKENENSELKHVTVLENCKTDPRRKIAEKLVRDIKDNSCIMVYHKSFEAGIIKSLAQMYPDLHDKLINISKNIVDLEPIFKNKDYYLKEFYGSSSLKHVLEGMFLGNEELNYNKFLYVKNGLDAASYLRCENNSKEIEDNLIKYCSLDTLAMSLIFDKLKEEVND